jgi:hypothetical protein
VVGGSADAGVAERVHLPLGRLRPVDVRGLRLRNVPSAALQSRPNARTRGADARGAIAQDTRKTGSEELELDDKRQRERDVLSASEAPEGASLHNYSSA